MSDRLVLNVNGLVKLEPVQPVEFDAVPSEENPGPPFLSDNKEEEVVSGDEEEPLIQSAECRICQDEDSIKNLETPCACSGSLKEMRAALMQRERQYKLRDLSSGFEALLTAPDAFLINLIILLYLAPKLKKPLLILGKLEDLTLGVWTISGPPLDLRDPRLLAIAEAERQFLETEYDEYAALNTSGAAFCRSAALVLMALLLLHHAFDVPDADSDEDVYTVFSIFLFRAAVILLPCYIMAWVISILQRRRKRQYQEAAGAATQVAFVLQSGQHGGMHFTIASGTTVSPQQVFPTLKVDVHKFGLIGREILLPSEKLANHPPHMRRWLECPGSGT
ncbi:PHD finger protein MALE STERILITY 1-like [Hibiscus syriacus]|uniref:PHD finger protein MALE STERILITY 1-like n=1 Tax=Hibiscus syriacus TaxID=106335 RepID=A0A6A2WS95_HIBSY|nr:PHD finger protein MALE STERILITY 1-like [Hibiscus syriacus]